jgi:hypothetical protein
LIVRLLWRRQSSWKKPARTYAFGNINRASGVSANACENWNGVGATAGEPENE